MAEQQPLVLCMENANGEEVSVRIEPSDDFQTFLNKAKSILGFDVDLNSITRNQPVSLNDNIYRFLVTAEQNAHAQDLSMQSFDQMLDPSQDTNDLVYILDDGTQIRASQIHFDNEDPPVDLTAEKIPFIKYTDDDLEDLDVENVLEENTKKYNIVESPVSRWSSKNASPKCSFVNSLPFKLVCNNTSVFEAQFTKYLESSTAKTYTTLNPVTNKNKSPRSLIRENYKSYEEKFNRGDDFTGYTREDILNMFKDSPVLSVPYENQNFNEKRKHVRKSDPTRAVHKSWNPKPSYDNRYEGILIGDNENQNCFICGKYVENNIDKLYLFDNEDQKLHRSSPQKKSSRQLKIICESCLGENFKPCRMKGPNQCLNPDEYLVIRNNQQYIFQKTNKIEFKSKIVNESGRISKEKPKHRQEKEKVEFVKVEIGSDGEIVTKPIDNDPRSSADDVIIVKDEGRDSSSDVEIVLTPEIDENIVDHLDDADEEVKEFLGKYQCETSTITELKCRFCDRIFPDLSSVMEHVDEHKHDYEEGVVYPCPICEYGYANAGWLKGHLKAAHDKKDKQSIKKEKTEDTDVNENVTNSTTTSPGCANANTSNSDKKNDNSVATECGAKPEGEKQSDIPETSSKAAGLVIKTEVKQEAIESSDDEIWIVQTGDETNEQLESLLHAAKGCQKEQKPVPTGISKKIMHKCFTCSRIFANEETLRTHICRRRGRKRKSPSKEDSTICVPTREDFIKRAQGRSRHADQPDNNLLVPRARRKKTKEPTSDPQIVTCHDCNESFTSKVRLKFHMQFHSSTNMLTKDGRYKCPECGDCTFDAEGALFDHVHFRHHKKRRWQCPVRACGKTFHLRATLTKHSRTHTDTRRYVCVTCGKRFLDKQTLDEHGVTHLQIKPFQCHICSKQLTRRSRLRMHLRAHEEELTPKLVLVCAVCSRAFRDHEDAQAHTTKSTECIEAFTKELKEETEEVTAQLSPTSGLVRETMQVVESPKLSKPIPRQVASPLARPLLSSLADEARSLVRVVEIEKAFRCEYCEDVFYLEDGLNTHRAIHKGVKNPFTCHICKVSFATYSRCTTHKTTHGFYKRPLADAKRQAWGPNAGPSATGILGYGGFPVAKHFLCEDCGRSYLHWTYLQVHRRMKHANDNFLYKCNQCDITFPNSWSLAYHRKKIHGQTGLGDARSTSKIPREDYRIPCRDCDEVLPNKTALYKHRKKEHSDMSLGLNDKPGTSWCGSCGKQHSSQCGDNMQHLSEVNKHMDGGAWRRSHACPVCGHTFRSASVRDEHLRTHTGERPFPCDLCGLAFRRSTAMRNHRLIHTGVRAWACSRCPKRFRIRSELRTHARLKHPTHLAVIEVRGLNPTPDEVLDHLQANNIAHDKVIEITKMSFHKGTSSIIPNCARALAMLGNVPRAPVAYSKPLIGDNDFQPARRGRGIAKNPRRPKILQRGEEATDQNAYPVALDVPTNLTDADVQMLLRDGVMVDGSQMVQLQIDDNLLLG